MDTDSLYLALAHENLYECIKSEVRSIWKEMRSNDCTDFFRANSKSIFFPRTCCDKRIKHDKREPDYSRRNSDVVKCYAYVAKRFAAIIQ